MKNPFIQAAQLMALMASAFKENAIRDFNATRGTPERSRKFKTRAPGNRIQRLAQRGHLTMRAPGRFGAPSL